jgi:prepilin-type N-terminal cleavage/methylation domain-containing protein/prepilin-type processing-associated H-X9-DG protein
MKIMEKYHSASHPVAQKSLAAAFTLVELLTVIAIIGILAAIILPVTAKVRQNARTAQCLSNIRQIAMANVLFAGENKGQLLVDAGAKRRGDGDLISPEVTQHGNWQKALASYMNLDKVSARSRFKCPEAKMTEQQINSGNETCYNVSKFLGEWLAGKNPGQGRLDMMEKPVIMVADTFISNQNFTYPWNISSSGGFSELAKRQEMFRHNGGKRRNVGMTDGSARILSPIQDGLWKTGSIPQPENLWLPPGAGTSASTNPNTPTDALSGS